MKISNIAVFSALMSASLQAATIIVNDAATNAIPDGSSSGLARQLTVNAPGETITDMQLDLSISALPTGVAYLGDLYVYLSHGTDLSVLLNRPGRRIGAPAGYSDNQSINVTFSGASVNDIHNYCLALNGNHNTALSSTLTGIWQPDGRAIDPALVLDSDDRTAGFDVFSGDLADGTWTLFAADLSTGAQHQITGWTLTLTTVPEPSSALLFVSAAAAFGLRRKRA